MFGQANKDITILYSNKTQHESMSNRTWLANIFKHYISMEKARIKFFYNGR